MTLEEKIALLLPKKKVCEGCGCSYSDEELKSCGSVSCCPDGDTWEHIYNTGIDQCATNLKQAFERGELCWTPNLNDLASIVNNEIAWNRSDDGPCLSQNEFAYHLSEAIISLLTKGKDNE